MAVYRDCDHGSHIPVDGGGNVYEVDQQIFSLLLPCLIAIGLSACAAGEIYTDIKPQEIRELPSGIVAENAAYTLSWDNGQKCVLLEGKNTAQTWSTVPYDFFLQGDTNVNLSSPLFISYYNPTDGSLMTAKALADCIELGNLSVMAEGGKIRMEFYFEDAEIMIPLVVSLDNDCLRATIEAGEIRESGKTQLIDISLLPYLCSVANTDDRSGYLFVPVGSGALMYTDEDVQEFSRGYSGEVYGRDAARYLLDDTVDEEPIRLPVFGAKAGDHALLAIIEEGAESAAITADSGNTRNGYSTVYASFTVRGHDETEVKRTDYSDAVIYAAEMNEAAVFSVGYYPLKDAEADYSGMAARYRKYLSERGMLTNGASAQQAYQLEFLGGSLVRDVMLGVPYMRMQTATTFDEARDIISELSEETGIDPSVLLKGFGRDGLDVGRLAGGFDFSKESGGKKRYNTLKNFCDSNGIPLFVEYDLVRFNRSSNGFHTTFDTAQTAGKRLAAFYPLKKNVRADDESYAKIRLLQRSELQNALEALLKKTDGVSGLSLTTLGSIAYSDYTASDYYAKGGMEQQVQSIFKAIKAEERLIGAGSANSYAAGLADSVFDVPLTNGGYFALDESIPFYQMVFHGSSALYSTPVNLAADWTACLLRAVEGGVSPTFTLAARADRVLADTLSDAYYGSEYVGVKEDMVSAIAKTSAYFKQIANQSITAHRILENGVTVTEFSDGTVVFVNHNTTDATAGGDVLPAGSFRYTKGGASETYTLMGGGQ